jgi:hypothetical protein
MLELLWRTGEVICRFSIGQRSLKCIRRGKMVEYDLRESRYSYSPMASLADSSIFAYISKFPSLAKLSDR